MKNPQNKMQHKILDWVDFMHIYQPPTQSIDVVREVANNSYKLIVRLLKQYPSYKITLNISGSLIELLRKAGEEQLLTDINELVAAQKIELVGSAMYHPILPLISEAEIRRQIELNENILNETFGKNYKKRGFYLPEMAYSHEVALIIKDMGFSWIILDEIHASDQTKVRDPEVHYSLSDGLSVVFRNRLFSRHFPPKKILTDIETVKSSFIITAHDGELYGQWHKNDEGYYEKILTSPVINTLTVSEYLNKLEKKEIITLRPTHWEASEEHLTSNNFLHLWNDEENDIHKALWNFTNLAVSLVTKSSNDTNFTSARKHLDKGLASCTWWWSSHQTLGYGYHAWGPDIIEGGLKEIIKSIRSLNSLSPETHIQAEKQYSDIIFQIWEYHWKNYSKK